MYASKTTFQRVKKSKEKHSPSTGRCWRMYQRRRCLNRRRRRRRCCPWGRRRRRGGAALGPRLASPKLCLRPSKSKWTESYTCTCKNALSIYIFETGANFESWNFFSNRHRFEWWANYDISQSANMVFMSQNRDYVWIGVYRNVCYTNWKLC